MCGIACSSAAALRATHQPVGSRDDVKAGLIAAAAPLPPDVGWAAWIVPGLPKPAAPGSATAAAAVTADGAPPSISMQHGSAWPSADVLSARAVGCTNAAGCSSAGC